MINLLLSHIVVPEMKQTSLSTSSDKGLGQSQKCEKQIFNYYGCVYKTVILYILLKCRYSSYFMFLQIILKV